ncbi:hypothetical protein WMO24_11165 [Ruthenibacterium sp. CLA-JM-H11]|uniref:Uncharacterized protein n=1 Tax=Ruthenibacterium intestinale TaxID=3133163 RepID=A0ABV1GGP6_9FIRM
MLFVTTFVEDEKGGGLTNVKPPLRNLCAKTALADAAVRND